MLEILLLRKLARHIGEIAGFILGAAISKTMDGECS